MRLASTEEEVKAQLIKAVEAEIYLGRRGIPWGEVVTTVLATALSTAVSVVLSSPQSQHETARLIKKLGNLIKS